MAPPQIVAIRPLKYPDRIGFWKCWFLRRGENRSTRGKTSRAEKRTKCSHHCAIPAPLSLTDALGRLLSSREAKVDSPSASCDSSLMLSNIPRASIPRRTYADHELIVKHNKANQVLILCEKGKLEKTSESRDGSQQSQPRYGLSPESNPGHIDGSECSYHFANAMICVGR